MNGAGGAGAGTPIRCYQFNSFHFVLYMLFYPVPSLHALPMHKRVCLSHVSLFYVFNFFLISSLSLSTVYPSHVKRWIGGKASAQK